MNKTLLLFSFFIFSFSLTKAQDTLAFKTGEKIAGKVTALQGANVYYVIPPKDTELSVNQSKLKYIHYSDGYTYYTGGGSGKDFDNTGGSKHPLLINFGAGLSMMELTILGGTFFNDVGNMQGPFFISETPAYNCTIDYTFFGKLSIGVGGAYQAVNDNPYEQPTSSGTDAFWATEKVIRYNISGRILYHFIQENKIDLYAGVRAGESIWMDSWVTYNPPSPNVSANLSKAPGTKTGSVQALIGFSVFPIYNIGFHVEAAIGTPYFLEGGITFRFKTRK